MSHLASLGGQYYTTTRLARQQVPELDEFDMNLTYLAIETASAAEPRRGVGSRRCDSELDGLTSDEYANLFDSLGGLTRKSEGSGDHDHYGRGSLTAALRCLPTLLGPAVIIESCFGKLPPSRNSFGPLFIILVHSRSESSKPDEYDCRESCSPQFCWLLSSPVGKSSTSSLATANAARGNSAKERRNSAIAPTYYYLGSSLG